MKSNHSSRSEIKRRGRIPICAVGKHRSLCSQPSIRFRRLLDQSMTEEEKSHPSSHRSPARFTELKATYRNAGIVQPNRTSTIIFTLRAADPATSAQRCRTRSHRHRDSGPKSSACGGRQTHRQLPSTWSGCADGSYHRSRRHQQYTDQHREAPAPSKGWTIKPPTPQAPSSSHPATYSSIQTNSGLGWKIKLGRQHQHTPTTAACGFSNRPDIRRRSADMLRHETRLVITDIELDGSAPYPHSRRTGRRHTIIREKHFCHRLHPVGHLTVACTTRHPHRPDTHRAISSTFSMLDGNRCIGPRYIGQNEL